MMFQDANQTNTWWCIGKLPPPWLVTTAGRDYWPKWVKAPMTAGGA
jgi:hypothetical protein